MDIQELICQISNFRVFVCKSVEVEERGGGKEESEYDVIQFDLGGNICDVV